MNDETERFMNVHRESIILELQDNFLSAQEKLFNFVNKGELSRKDYKSILSDFARDWGKQNLGIQLDNDQGFAVVEQGGDIRVTARAGSGKTRTLVSRAIFLINHCQIDPKSLLLLAFNTKAAEEMRQRLQEVLGENMPFVMTFHALAVSLVHPVDEIMIDGETDQTLSRFVQELIEARVADPNDHSRIANFMIEYFRDEWDQYVRGGYYLKIDDFLSLKRNLPTETLNGEYVKSYGERLIANTLFEYGVEYKYEKYFYWDGRSYRPDFSIELRNGGGVIIEYFGLSGNQAYDKTSAEKRNFWSKKPDWQLIECSPADIASYGSEEFRSRLIAELNKCGIKTSKLSDEDIWNKIKKRAIGQFDSLTRQFISRVRKSQWTTEDLSRHIKKHKSESKAETQFLELQDWIYPDYLAKLIHESCDDFDGILQKAVVGLRNGNTRFSRDKGKQVGDVKNISFVMVDEFQDISTLFFELLEGLRLNSQALNFFCVGDDWQAINSFAGSELNYFNRFSDFFVNSIDLEIVTNYRSPMAVVELGNSIMEDRGTPAIAHRSDVGSVELLDMCSTEISGPERDEHKGDQITPVLLRVINAALLRGENVVLLSRSNNIAYYVNYPADDNGVVGGLEKFITHVRSYFPEDDQPRITISTAHGYKGRENEAVVIIDAKDGCYPLIHPNWKYLRIFGISIDRVLAEERRLLYVAATRATRSVVIITSGDQKSQFIGELEKILDIKQIEFTALPRIDRIENHQVLIRVFNCFAVKDELKKEGFKWDPTTKAWFRYIASQSFKSDEYVKRSWNIGDVLIQVFGSNMRMIWDSKVDTLSSRKNDSHTTGE